jgi:hypothetical protein
MAFEVMSTRLKKAYNILEKARTRVHGQVEGGTVSQMDF